MWAYNSNINCVINRRVVELNCKATTSITALLCNYNIRDFNTVAISNERLINAVPSGMLQ